MKLPNNITLDQIIEAVQLDDNIGFCLDCGEENNCVEPDARERKCEACGECKVYGAQELLMMFGA